MQNYAFRRKSLSDYFQQIQQQIFLKSTPRFVNEAQKDEGRLTKFHDA